jgi:hypothetical protein
MGVLSSSYREFGLVWFGKRYHHALFCWDLVEEISRGIRIVFICCLRACTVFVDRVVKSTTASSPEFEFPYILPFVMFFVKSIDTSCNSKNSHLLLSEDVCRIIFAEPTKEEQHHGIAHLHLTQQNQNNRIATQEPNIVSNDPNPSQFRGVRLTSWR